MNISRTSKQFDANDIDQNFVQQALSLGGKDSCVLRYDFSKFVVTNHYGGRYKNSSSMICAMSTWDESQSDLYDKVLDRITVSAGSFDTEIVIWQDGRIQGYYLESCKAQYAADPIKWCNLLLKYGYLQIT